MNILSQSYRNQEILKTRPLTRYVPLILALCILLMTACNRSDAVTESGQASGQTAATSSGSTPQAGKINVCALVTKADAELILGESVKDTDGDGSGGCAYEITDYGVGGRTAVLMVGIETDGKMAYEMHKKMSGITDGLMDVARDDAALDDSQREAEKQTDRKIQPLSGIGDKGYMSGGFRGGFMGSATVSVLKGDTWILVQIIGSPKKGSEEALKAVVKKVADAF
ncbi:MAG: hypothetical protein H0W76_10640 [Pyrinomonadaceae bacterium]|nr:hypothetical protein [Pyrinomonadaceae bacterium]